MMSAQTKNGGGVSSAPTRFTGSSTSSLVSSLSRYHYYERELNALRAHAQGHLQRCEDSLLLDRSLDQRSDSPGSAAMPMDNSAPTRAESVTTLNTSPSPGRRAGYAAFPTVEGRGVFWATLEAPRRRASGLPSPFSRLSPPTTRSPSPPRDVAANVACCGRFCRRVECWTEPAIDCGALPTYEGRFLKRLDIWKRQSPARFRDEQRWPHVTTSPVERLSFARGLSRDATPIRELTPASRRYRNYPSPLRGRVSGRPDTHMRRQQSVVRDNAGSSGGEETLGTELGPWPQARRAPLSTEPELFHHAREVLRGDRDTWHRERVRGTSVEGARRAFLSLMQEAQRRA